MNNKQHNAAVGVIEASRSSSLNLITGSALSKIHNADLVYLKVPKRFRLLDGRVLCSYLCVCLEVTFEGNHTWILFMLFIVE